MRPSVWPRSSEKLTSRTAVAGPRCVCSRILRLLTSSKGMKRPVPLALSGQTRVEHIAQAVAHQIEPQDCQHNGHSRKDRQ